MSNLLLVVFCAVSRSRIYLAPLAGDELQNLDLCLDLTAFEAIGIFIVSYICLTRDLGLHGLVQISDKPGALMTFSNL